DARAGRARLLRGEHGDHRADAAAVGGDPQVLDGLVEDAGGRPDVAPVADDQAAPVQAPDAAAGVAPGDGGAVGQLGAGVGVGAGLVDGGQDLADAGLRVAGRRVLGEEL